MPVLKLSDRFRFYNQGMLGLLIAFFTSFAVSIFIIRTQKFHGGISGDLDFNGPQKFHKHVVPRIGGLAIGIALFLATTLHYKGYLGNKEEIFLLISALPAFGIGIAEDISKKVSVRIRLLFTAAGSLIFILLLNSPITHLDIRYIDLVFSIPIISICFTMFAITGLANAYNIIDGFNGLTSMVGMITLVALGYVGLQLNDSLIIFLSLIMIGAILGFFIWNYPRGLIFLGDGGAYLIGFWVATSSTLIVNRHPEISPWFAVVVNAYPILETLFTIYRRKFYQGKSPGHPDGIHFHSLIFRRILNPLPINNEFEYFSANAKTSPYLWVLSSFAIIPAILFWESTPILIACLALFTITYVWLYKSLVTFKTPKWMRL
jgi:UDP-N-acetylmuramyl pentapeptide phosphotransferase/UDP-N-acetylglucosamine-1-phosphate transferase